MNSNEIEIIIKILQNYKKFDIAKILEKSIFELDMIDGWNGGIYDVIIKINPVFYLKSKQILNENIEILIDIFKGLYPDININNIKSAINKNINITNDNVTYIFVDEAGNMDFSEKGTKYYIFTFLIKKRPFYLYDYLQSYRLDLLEEALQGNFNIDIEAFHASYDNKFVKENVFKIISSLSIEKIKIYSYILEKPKIIPSKTKEKGKFYINNLIYATKKLLNKIQIDEDFIIFTDKLPIEQNKKNQIKAFKEGINEFIKDKKLSIKYKIFHHCSASNINLQIVDYICWAIFRKYERNDNYYYKMIKKFILEEDLVTKDRNKSFY